MWQLDSSTSGLSVLSIVVCMCSLDFMMVGMELENCHVVMMPQFCGKEELSVAEYEYCFMSLKSLDKPTILWKH